MTRILLTALFLLFSAPALAIYKCEVDGKILYTDQHCPKNASINVPVKQTVTDRDAENARQQVRREQHALANIEKTRAADEARAANLARQRARSAGIKKHKCDALAQRRNWLAEDLKQASAKSADKAKRNLRRATEKYDVACK